VPARDQQGVGSTQARLCHQRRGRGSARGHARCSRYGAGSHAAVQPRLGLTYSGVIPGTLNYSREAASALPDPDQPGLSARLCWPVLTVAPGAARAIFMLPLAAGQADHRLLQAALARRIRRRRSADRSSSFRPPHVPYFSGRLTA